MSDSAPEVWVFGEPALEQTERFARVARDVIDLVLRLEQPEARLDQMIAELEAARHDLTELVPPDPRPRVGEAIDGDGRVYLDHGRDVGAFNPAMPEYELTVDGDRASGTVTFPAIYEGPPGFVHGGFLACFFDAVIQQHNCEVGQAGKTSGLELRYSAPTPLLTELRFEIVRHADDQRIESTAELFAGDTRCVTAVLRAARGVRANLPPVDPRRPR